MMHIHFLLFRLIDEVLPFGYMQVLLFSIMGPQHARIIQGHINGNELVVYYTKFHDFRYKKNAPMDFFAQWYYCKPTGQTMSNKK